MSKFNMKPKFNYYMIFQNFLLIIHYNIFTVLCESFIKIRDGGSNNKFLKKYNSILY